MGEVPKSFVGWLKPPRVITRPFHKDRRGRGRKVPASGQPAVPAPRRVEELLERRGLRDQPWQRCRVKDGEKGPMVWEVKHALFIPKDEDGLPGEPMHLIVARNVLDPDEVKFFVSNAPAGDPGRDAAAGGLLAVAGGALFRGPEGGNGPGSLRGPALPGAETPPDPHCGELPVPGADAPGIRGGKTRS